MINSTLVEVAFSSIDKFITYERKYSKLQNSLGNIGGWIRIILVVCQFISDYFSEKIFLVDIINAINHVEQKKIPVLKIKKMSEQKINNYMKEEINSNYKIQNSPISIKPSVKDNKSENLNLSNIPITQEITMKKEYFERNKIIHFTVFEYLLPLWTMKKNDKYSFFLYYKDFIYKDISLEVLVPLVERLLKLNIIKDKPNRNEYISQLSNTAFNMNFTNTKTNAKK